MSILIQVSLCLKVLSHVNLSAIRWIVFNVGALLLSRASEIYIFISDVELQLIKMIGSYFENQLTVKHLSGPAS